MPTDEKSNKGTRLPLIEEGRIADIKAGRSGRPKYLVTKETTPQTHHYPNKCYTVFMDFINMSLTAGEIALVLYLTIHHFQESMGVIAITMLAPILLNFVGVTYFFSDKNERTEFEHIGTTRLTKDMFQVPVFGPVFTAIKVLLVSTGLSKRTMEEYERFEASAVKMRQAQTFFSAAPEAMVQLSVLLISREPHLTTTHILEITVVIVSICTLAESNLYALRSNYFRLFRSYEANDWKVHETFWRKCILFLHSFCSIGARVASTACLIGGVQVFAMRIKIPDMKSLNCSPAPSNNKTRSMTMINFDKEAMKESKEATQELGYIIALTFISLILYHMIVYYIARLLRYKLMRRDAPGGCYESINYGWRSTILHTGFQSKNIATQIWFYTENCAMYTFWWFIIQKFDNSCIKSNTQIRVSLLFILSMVFSVFLLFAAVGTGMHRLHSPFKDYEKYKAPSPK